MRADKVDFNGNRFRLSGNYYRRNCWGQTGPSNLHRAVWEYHNGPVPDGFELHHIDGDTFNNDISNLAALPVSTHQRAHTLERIAAGKLQPPCALALQRAAEWHKSPTGIAWHKKHGAHTWDNRVWHTCYCAECGQEFMSPYPTRAKFCHTNCKSKYRRRLRGVCVRPDNRKERVLSGKRCPCK
jgi:hypothetical protein